MTAFPWNKIKELIGRELKTLGTTERFKIVRLDDYAVYLRPTKGTHEREIPRTAFLKAWQRLGFRGAKMTRTELDSLADRQGTYMAAILSQLPGLEATKEPPGVRRSLVDAPTVSDDRQNQFVVVNQLAKTFHLTECSSMPKIARWHRSKMTRGLAISTGYEPCGRCQPDK
jgi:hypothetical protein